MCLSIVLFQTDLRFRLLTHYCHTSAKVPRQRSISGNRCEILSHRFHGTVPGKFGSCAGGPTSAGGGPTGLVSPSTRTVGSLVRRSTSTPRRRRSLGWRVP